MKYENKQYLIDAMNNEIIAYFLKLDAEYKNRNLETYSLDDVLNVVKCFRYSFSGNEQRRITKFINKYTKEPIVDNRPIINMTKDEYRQQVLISLENTFGYPIYFNGNEAKTNGLNYNGYLGVSYLELENNPCVILWQRKLLDTLQTTFHEIGHSSLHNKETGIDLNKYLKEIEAEMVAKRACELLKLPYREHFRRSKTNYIEYNKKKYENSCVKLGVSPVQPRIEMIEDVAQKIYLALKDLKLKFKTNVA